MENKEYRRIDNILFSETYFRRLTEKFSKIEGLYEAALKHEKLTTKRLNELGFDSRYIRDLIKQGVLERVERGKYNFISVYGLRDYGLSCYRDDKKGNIKKAQAKKEECIDACFEMDPTDPGICFQMFSRFIYKRQYNKIWEFLDILIGYNKNPYDEINPCFINDTRYYLLLLSYLVKVPDKYKDTLKSLTYDDICTLPEDNRISDDSEIEKQNEIRKLVLEGKVCEAYSIQGKVINNEGQMNFKFQNYLILKLMSFITGDVKSLEREIAPLYDEERYADIISIIERRYGERRRCDGVECLLLLIEKARALKEERPAPRSVLAAVLVEDYESALEMVPEEERDYLRYRLLTEIDAMQKEKRQASVVVESSPAVESSPLEEISEPDKTEIGEPVLIEHLKSESLGPIVNKKIVVVNPIRHAENTIQELSEKHGIAILPPMDNETSNEVKKLIFDNPSIDWFNIDVDGQTRLVLKYSTEYPRYMDKRQQSEMASKAYSEGDYEKALEINLDTFTNTKKFVSEKMYYYLGNCYQMLDRPREALDCFLVYQYLSQRDLCRVDVSKQIVVLKSELEYRNKISGLTEEEPSEPGTQGHSLSLTPQKQ